MNKTLLLSVLAFAMALATTAFAAYPTLAGPTGGLDAPTAMVQDLGQFTVAADWIDTDPDSAYAARALFGIFPGLEVGASFVDADSSDWNVNAKYAFPLPLLGAKWGFGALYQHDADLAQVYVAATKGFTPLVNGTLGAIYSDMNDATDTQGFANLEVGLMDIVSVGGEYFFGGDVEDSGNVYARLSFSDMFGIQVGVQGLTSDAAEDIVNAGAKINF